MDVSSTKTTTSLFFETEAEAAANLDVSVFTALHSNLAEIRFRESARFQACGWLRDKDGVSWQLVPPRLTEIMGNADPTRRGKAMKALTNVKKIVIQHVLDVVEGNGGHASER